MQDLDRVEQFQQQVEEEAKALGLLENEVKTEEGKSVEKEYSEVEKEQMALGWDPNKSGPTAVSAEEFKRVGQIIEAKRAASKKAEAASKEVQELSSTVKSLLEHNRKLQEAQLAKELKEVEARKEDRILSGDVQGVHQIELEKEALIRTYAEPEKSVPAEQEFSKEVLDYKDRNDFWLTGPTQEDRKMQIFTNKVIDYLREAEPNIDEKTAIDIIEKKVRAEFPTRFENTNKDKAPLVMQSTSTKGGTPPSSYAEFSQHEKNSFNQIKKVDPTYTIKEHAELLESVGRR